MNIATSKQPSKSSRKAQSSSEARFDKAWQRVANQQKKNARLREEVKAFAQRVSAAIQDQEKAYVDILYQTCEHLLVFYGRKALSVWQRDILLGWVTDYISAIRTNPFAADLDLSSLLAKMRAVMAKMHPELASGLHEDAGPDGDAESASGAADEHGTMEDLFEELADEFGHDPDFEEFADWFAEQNESFESAHQQRKDEDQALAKLMKDSSINKLFRKVARVLHPDREQDEDARIEKNRLMSELVEARDANDITTIFTFYTEYVGESPLQALGGDLDGVTALLQRQYENLREQQEDILHEDPVAGVLYQRFHKKSDKAVWRNIEVYRSELEDDTARLRQFRAQVTSVNKLKPYLMERWDEMNQAYPFDFD